MHASLRTLVLGLSLAFTLLGRVAASEDSPARSPVPRDGFHPKLYFIVPPGADSARVSIEWDFDAARPPALQFVRPDFLRIARELFVPQPEPDLPPNTVIDRTELNTPRRRVLELHRPSPGRWAIEMNEARPELGWLRLAELDTPPLPPPPRVEWAQNYRSLISPGRIEIAWRVHHLPPDARVGLSYGGEASSGPEIPGVRHDGELYVCSWDTTALKTGAYFLTAFARTPDGAPLAQTLFPVIVKVKGRPRLELALQTPAVVHAGGTVDVLALVENTGDEPSSAVEVSFRLPSDLPARIVEPSTRLNEEDDDRKVLHLEPIPPGVTRLARLALAAPPQTGDMPLSVELTSRGPLADLAPAARAGIRRDIRIVAPGDPAAPTLPDLRVERSAINGRLMLGERLAYTVTVSNRGRATAHAVRLFESLNVAQFDNLQPSQGAAKILLSSSNHADASLGDIAPGASATVVFECRAYVASSLHTQSSVFASEPDAEPLDNVTPADLHDRIEPAPAD